MKTNRLVSIIAYSIAAAWAGPSLVLADAWPVDATRTITVEHLPVYTLEPALMPPSRPVTLRVLQQDIGRRQFVSATFGEHRPAGLGQTHAYLHN